jgi:hypothetical protein
MHLGSSDRCGATTDGSANSLSELDLPACRRFPLGDGFDCLPRKLAADGDSSERRTTVGTEVSRLI